MHTGVVRSVARRSLWVVLLLPWLGCGTDLGTCDMAALLTTTDPAMTQPYKGQQLVHQTCASGLCHSEAAEGASRHGAPAGLNFDLVMADSSDAQKARVTRGEATVDEQASEMWEWISDGMMPPEGDRMALAGDDKEAVRNWLACGAPVVKAPLTSTTADWGQIFPVLEATCGACHGATSATGPWLVMGDACATRMNLIGTPPSGPSCGSSGAMLVVPSNPDASLIVSKLESMAPTCGGVMPPDRSPSAPSTLAPSLRQWIAAGATSSLCP